MRAIITAFLFLCSAVSWSATFTPTIGTSVQSNAGTVTPTIPAGSTDGKLILVYSANNDFNGRVMTTPPSGYIELAATQPGTNKSSYLWGKIGTASESNPTIVWQSGDVAAWVIVVESSTGWPAIGSVLAGASTGSGASPAGSIQYIARTTTTDGNFIVQLGKRPSPGAPTAVAVTSGWTSAGNYLSTTLVPAAAGQYRTVSGNAAANAVAMTGGSGTNATAGITAEFIPNTVSAPTLTLSDATPDIDTTVTATLSGAFGAGGNPTTATLSSGDTVSCSSATSTTCDFPLNYSALVASGGLDNTQLKTALTVTVTNGTETSQSTAINIQVPASGYAIVDLTCTAGVDCTADSEAISPMVAGDDCAIKVTSGVLSSLSTHCAPIFSSPNFAYTAARFDESAGAWLSQEEVTVTAPVSCRKAVSSAVQPAVQSAARDAACLLNVSRP